MGYPPYPEFSDLKFGRTFQGGIDALSDPDLDCDRDREMVNKSVVSLITHFIEAYFDVDDFNCIDLSVYRRINSVFSGYWTRFFQWLGSIEPRTGDITLADRCLLDVPKTAAIFKEIAFNDAFELDEGRFRGLDIGSGTGILMVAMAIAARRKSAQVIDLVGVEQYASVARRSRRVLKRLLSGCNVRVERANFIQSHECILNSVFPPSFWVSETFGQTTSLLSQASKAPNGLLQEILPLAHCLTTVSIPDFDSRVAGGRTAMFPDMVAGLNLEKNTLRLQRGISDLPHPFSKIGEEFEALIGSNFPYRRW